MEYLISTGRRAIGTVTGPLDMHAGVSRHLGFREALAPADLADHRVAHADFSELGGATATARLLDEHPDLDALFVTSDTMAAGALHVLRERGRSVPGDVAVVGFNDILTARHTQPP
ncbi:substrate-binding domain-containing protein [Streptomyces sp. SAS_276]|uniref:substrate-binding domain-containing protein n=1 Tax=Streptomyces sp. SAS_276 TaxID=3412745 RepID=UPI00403CBD58